MKAVILLALIFTGTAHATTSEVSSGCKVEKQEAIMDGRGGFSAPVTVADNFALMCSDGTGSSGAGYPSCRSKEFIDGNYMFGHMPNDDFSVITFTVWAPLANGFLPVVKQFSAPAADPRSMSFTGVFQNSKPAPLITITCK